MPEELTYVLINPYTIIKSRTGGVIARLLSRASAELVATRMFAPSQALIDEYLQSIADYDSGGHPEIKQLIYDYVKDNYSPNKKTGERRRVMFLLFRGEDARRRLHDEVVGHITRETIAGETIRDTYGDYVKSPDGKIKYFEPAVMMPPTSEVIQKQLEVWVRYSDSDSGLLNKVINYPEGVIPENTLVLIKPDCFRWPSGRPGSIIDMFSKTGLYIIGTKLVRMSISKAEEFYAPVKDVLREKLKDQVIEKIHLALSEKFDFPVPPAVVEVMAGEINDLNTENQFNQIIKFMTGMERDKLESASEQGNPATAKCLALVYQGEDAVRKIRDVLGATDPSKAAPSTVRKEFGRDVLVNTAHASDSAANAKREMGIINIEGNDLKKIVTDFYKGK